MLAADGQPAIIFGKLEIVVIAGVLHPRRCIFPDTSTALGFDPASSFSPIRGLLTEPRECYVESMLRLIGGNGVEKLHIARFKVETVLVRRTTSKFNRSRWQLIADHNE